MHRDFRLYLDDILEAIHQIRTYLSDQGEEAFTKDRKPRTPSYETLRLSVRPQVSCLSKFKMVSRRLTGVRLQVYATFSFISISLSICQLYGMWFKTNWVRWNQSVEDFWRALSNRQTKRFYSNNNPKIYRRLAIFGNTQKLQIQRWSLIFLTNLLITGRKAVFSGEEWA